MCERESVGESESVRRERECEERARVWERESVGERVWEREKWEREKWERE